MKTGLTKKQKVTEVYYNAKDPIVKLKTAYSGLAASIGISTTALTASIATLVALPRLSRVCHEL